MIVWSKLTRPQRLGRTTSLRDISSGFQPQLRLRAFLISPGDSTLPTSLNARICRNKVDWHRQPRLRSAIPIGEEPLMTALHSWKSRLKLGCHGDSIRDPGRRLSEEPRYMGIRRALLLPLAAVLATLSATASAQSVGYSADSSGSATTTIPGRLDVPYVRPTHKIKAGNYLFDAYGPYPIAGAAVAAGINQLSNAPPEWGEGVEGFGKRFGSDFGIAAIGTSARFGLAEALKEDTLYYRCECSGTWPRMSHAVISTFTARRGEDGHRVFSIPALVAPYAGTMTAVYVWFPDRFGAKDAFRMGNYSLLAYMGGNLALEFFHSRKRSRLSRMHLDNSHDSTVKEPNQ